MARNNSVTFRSENFQVTSKMNKDEKISIDSRKIYTDNKSGGEKLGIASLLSLVSSIPFLRGVMAMFEVYVNKKIGALVFLIIVLGIISPLVTGAESLMIPISTINLFAFIILSLTVFLLKFSEISKYHSAEHMVGNNFTHNRKMTLENVKKSSRIHRHCGTNLAILALIIFECVINLFDQLSVNILTPLLYVSAGIAFEIHVTDNKLLNKIFYPFYFVSGIIQFLTVTSHPSEKHLQVAIEAFKEIERLETEK